MPSTYTTTILITGGTTGLGWHTALTLSKTVPSSTLIIIASRSAPNTPLPTANVKYLKLDLVSAAGVKTFIDTWSTSSYPPISALILNAGLQFVDKPSYSPDGIEITLAINHLGNAHLYHRLSNGGFLAPRARVLLVGSQTHDPAAKTGMPDAYYNTAEEIARPTPAVIKDHAVGNGRQRYATSKLCNIMWTFALSRRLASEPAATRKTVLCFNPGLMPGTGLAREAPGWQQWIWKSLLPRILPFLRVVLRTDDIRTMEESGRNLAWMATCQELEGTSGAYYHAKGKVLVPSPVARDEKKQEELYEWTVKQCAGGEGETDRFERGW